MRFIVVDPRFELIRRAVWPATKSGYGLEIATLAPHFFEVEIWIFAAPRQAARGG
jgi:hypothetical protein